MSIVSSYISSRAPVFRINVQVSTFMDHILAIVAGLGVRIVIDLVGYEDHKLTGSLVGLWEGVVVQHFIKKSPTSFDPYVAYGLRVFIDFLFTESLIRLVLTFLFTGMGIVLADIAPRVSADIGLRRFWRHLRRDLYILVHSLPSIPPRPRTVRFSPSRTPSVITSVSPSPSVITITTKAPTAPVPRKRPVPGSFPDYVSETDTDLSIRSPGPDYSALAGHRRDRRPTVQTESETSHDPDEDNRSSSDSGTPTPVLSEADLSNLPDIEDEDVAREIVLENFKDENTPRPPPIKLPPTPSDTTFPVRLSVDEYHEIPPPSAGLPQIPDDDEGWENTGRRGSRASYEDKSISPFLVASQLSSPPVDSSTTLAAGAQPMHVSNVQKPEILELDPFAEQSHPSADGGPAATSTDVVASTPANIDDNGPSVPLVDLNNSGFATQANNSRPPSYAQLDFQLWVSNTPPANLGKNLDLWGDKQGDTIVKARSNEFEFDAVAGTTDPSEELQKPNDTEHAKSTVEENDKEQKSELPPNTDVTTEDLINNMPASQPDDARSGPSATQQEGQDPTSPAPQPGAPTAQQAEDTSSASNGLTDAESSNNRQDDSANEEPAAAQLSAAEETNGKEDKEPIVGGENIEAVTLTAPSIVEEPFPEKNSDRLDKALELRSEIAQTEEVLNKNKSKMAWPSSTVSRVELSAQMEKEEAKLKSLKAKAERWYSLVSESGANPSTKVDLSEAAAEVFMGRAQTAIIACLLKNIRKVVILVGPTDDKPGKGRKSALTARLDKLKLADRVYQVGKNEVTIHLPTSS